MTFGDRTIDVDDVAGAFDLEGEQLDIRDLTASRPGTALRANGSIAFRDDATTVDVSVSGSSAIESWWAEFSDEAGPVGHVEATAHVTGPLSEPTITFESPRPIAGMVRRAGQHDPGNRWLRSRPAVAQHGHAGHCRRNGRRSWHDRRGRHAPSESHRGAVGRISMHARFQGPTGLRARSRRAARRSSNGAAKRHRRPRVSTSAPPPALSRPAGRPRLTCGDRVTPIAGTSRWPLATPARWTSAPPPTSASTRDDGKPRRLTDGSSMRTIDLPRAIRQAQAFGGPPESIPPPRPALSRSMPRSMGRWPPCDRPDGSPVAP